MRRFAPLFVVATLMLASGTARAGYLTAGISSEANLSGDLATHFSTQGQGGGLVGIGFRFGQLALEGSLAGSDMFSRSALGDRLDYTAISAGADLKYFVGLTGPLEAYGKFGLHRTWLTSHSDAGLHESGDSWAAGAGLQLGFSLGPIGQAGLVLDFTHRDMDLSEAGRRDLEGGARTLTLGMLVGF